MFRRASQVKTNVTIYSFIYCNINNNPMWWLWQGFIQDKSQIFKVFLYRIGDPWIVVNKYKTSRIAILAFLEALDQPSCHIIK